MITLEMLESEITPSETLAEIQSQDLLPRRLLLTPVETAAALRTTAGGLAVARCKGRRPGLRFVKQGRRIFYKRSDVLKYINGLK